MAQIKRISPNNRNIVPGIGLDKNLYVKAGDFNPLIDQVNTNTTDIADIMDGFLYQGVIDCAANPNYPAATQDQYWRVSGAGLIGGGSGTAVEVGDEIICIVTNGGGTQAAVGTSFMIVQKNMIPCTVAVLRTGTNDTDFVTANTLADALNGGTAWTSAADIVNLSGGTASQLSITTSAAAIGVNIAQTAATDSAIKIYSGNNSASASIINVDSYQTAHLDGTDHLRGADVLLDSNGGDLDGSSYSCFWGTAIATTGGRADGIVYSATLRGTRDTADTTQGLGISFGDSVLDYTQDNVGCQAYGVRIAAQGDHIHTHGQWYGLHVNKTSVFTPATTADTATGLYIAGTYTNAIDLRGCLPADEAYTVAGSGTRNHPFLNVGSWDSPVTIANTLDHVAAIQVNISNTGAASTSNFAAARFRSDTGAASTANHYGVQIRNSVAHDVASAYGFNASMNVGAITIGTGAMAVGSFYLEGTGVITPAGANPIDVVNITNVHAGGGIDNVLNVCNNTASNCSQVATISNLSGAVTNMLYINNDNTATNGIHIAAGTYQNFININQTTLIDGANPYFALNIESKLASSIQNSIAIASGNDVANADTLSSINLIHTNGLAAATTNFEIGKFSLVSNFATGTWANAVAAKIDYSVNGFATGIAGVFCGELDMPTTATASGTYGVIEAEINYPAAQGVPVSFGIINVWGAGATSFDSNGYLFDITGVADGVGNFFGGNTDTPTKSLKVRINGTPYYIMLSEATS